MQNTIERDITVKAPKERVYSAISDPAQVSQWFPDKVEGSMDVGERPIFDFGSMHHRTQIYIEAAKPYDYFAYRWVPGATGIMGDVLKVPNTLVEFFIEEKDENTTVRVKESGFASLPADVAEASYKQNTEGWGFMIGRLEKLMNS